LSFYEGVGVGVLKIEESEVLCAGSTDLVVLTGIMIFTDNTATED
jgi:hypothetical protein